MQACMFWCRAFATHTACVEDAAVSRDCSKVEVKSTNEAIGRAASGDHIAARVVCIIAWSDGARAA